MTASCLLDTPAVLAHHRQEPGWARVQSPFDDAEQVMLLSALSLAELARRLRALGAGTDAIEAALGGYAEVTRVVPVGSLIARAAFDVCCRTLGRLPLVGAVIAATAMTHGARLVHRDRHMAAIPGSIVEQIELSGEA